MNKSRLEAFTDAIVAIAATIMVLQFSIPSAPTWQGLGENGIKLLAYLVSFLMIYLGWFAHHNLFKKAERVTTRTFTINGFWIFLCSLVPFTTAWVGHAPNAVAPEVLYHANLLLWRISFQLLDRQILHDNPDAEPDSSRDKAERWTYYLAFAVSIAIDLARPLWGMYATALLTGVMVVRSLTSPEAASHG